MYILYIYIPMFSCQKPVIGQTSVTAQEYCSIQNTFDNLKESKSLLIHFGIIFMLHDMCYEMCCIANKYIHMKFTQEFQMEK